LKAQNAFVTGGPLRPHWGAYSAPPDHLAGFGRERSGREGEVSMRLGGRLLPDAEGEWTPLHTVTKPNSSVHLCFMQFIIAGSFGILSAKRKSTCVVSAYSHCTYCTWWRIKSETHYALRGSKK